MIASIAAAPDAKHIDGPCGTVVFEHPTTAAHAIAAVNSGAATAASTHTSYPNAPVSAPTPAASLTSPAPIPAGATRWTMRYRPVRAPAPINAGPPRPTAADTRRITIAPGTVNQLGNRRSRMSYRLRTASHASTDTPAAPAPIHRG